MRTSKYSNQTKVICGLTYHSHEYAYPFEGAKYKKLRVTTTYNDVDYEYWTSTQTWKNASENKNSTFDPNGWRFLKFFKEVKDAIKKVVKRFSENMLPMIYNPIRKNFIGETDEQSIDYIGSKFAFAETSKNVRRLYKQFVKYYHPDMLGRNLFPHEQLMLDWLKLMKKMFIKRIDYGNDFLNNVWEDDTENTTEEEMVANFKTSEFYDESMTDDDILEFIRKMC